MSASSSLASSLPSLPPRRPGRPHCLLCFRKKQGGGSVGRRRAQSRICTKEQIGGCPSGNHWKCSCVLKLPVSLLDLYVNWPQSKDVFRVGPFPFGSYILSYLARYEKYKRGGHVCRESQVKQDTDGSSVLKTEEDFLETSSAVTVERWPCIFVLFSIYSLK